MRSRRHGLCTILAFLVVTSLAGCGGGAGGGATPEATFENFKTAMKNKDYKTAFAQTTPETQEIMIGGMSMMLSFASALDPSKGPDAQKILDKHGVKKLDLTQMIPAADPKMAMKQLTANVKDKPACLAEIITWLETDSTDKQSVSTDFGAIADAVLVDLKAEGDTASGTVRTKHGDQVKTDPAKFKKVAGVWLIDLSDMGPQGASGADAMPHGGLSIPPGMQ